MSETNPQSAQWKALKKIVKRLPAHLAYYGSALGAIVIAGSGAEGLASIVGNIGAGLLGNLIAEVAKVEDILDDDIRQRAEEAVIRSDIERLLTERDFWRAYVQLIRRLDAQKAVSQDIVDELRDGFSKVATAAQMEEVKELLIQILGDKKPSSKPRVFISYRRSDASDFALRLHDALETADIDAWLDVRDMPSGDTFIAQIDRAIAAADYFLLVGTPQAIESDYCRDEWKKAIEKYKPIIPLMLMGEYKDLPQEAYAYLNDARDFRDDSQFDAQVAQLEKQIQVKPTSAGEARGLPSLPSHYLPRPELLATLREALTQHKTTVLTSPSHKIGVQGMGGVGKSVLAMALARDYFVRRTFRDGVFWLTLGTAPRLFDVWTQLAGYLGYEGKSFKDAKEAQDFFEQATQGKEVLLILDDIWDGDHAEAFLHLGENCRLFASSRQENVLHAIDVHTCAIGILTDTEAEALLKRVAKVNVLPAQGTGIIQACGNLPLAIAMIGAMVQGKRETYWQDALDALLEADLEGIAARFPEYPHANLFLSLKVSIDALNSDLRERYYDFAIFPDDVAIPEEVPLTFWKPAKARDVRKKLDELVSRNLLTRADDGTLSLHDLQLNYLRRVVADRPQRNQRLLQQYNPDDVAWQNVCDKYLWKKLVYHLGEAKLHSDILRTVDKPFISAQIRHLQSYSSIFDDLRSAIMAAEAVGNLNRMLGLALIYNGFQTKMIQLGSSEVIPLYARFGEVARALEFARAIEDPNKQAEALVKVAKEIWVSNRTQAHQLAQEVLSRWKRYEPGYTFGQILCQLQEIFPEEVIGFFERVEDFTPIHSLGHSSFGIAYEQIDILAPKLSTDLQTRLTNALIKKLPLAEHRHLQSELRRLLARVIPDPDTARTFADDQVSQLIVAAKAHIAKESDTPLPSELIESAMKVFVEEATQDEKDVLYRYIISPYYVDVYAFVSAMRSPAFALNTDERIQLLLDLTYRLIKIDAHFDEARKLLLEALELNDILRGLDATITRNSRPGSFYDVPRKQDSKIAQ